MTHSFQPIAAPTTTPDSNELAPSALLLHHDGAPEPPEPPAPIEAVRSIGSLRERRPGVWEIRIAVGRDALAGTP